jgi:hypothetical protein
MLREERRKYSAMNERTTKVAISAIPTWEELEG